MGATVKINKKTYKTAFTFENNPISGFVCILLLEFDIMLRDSFTISFFNFYINKIFDYHKFGAYCK